MSPPYSSRDYAERMANSEYLAKCDLDVECIGGGYHAADAVVYITDKDGDIVFEDSFEVSCEVASYYEHMRGMI